MECRQNIRAGKFNIHEAEKERKEWWREIEERDRRER